MAIRSDEITSILKSAIDSFDAGVETRSVGTVVEVGDGIAQIYGLDAAQRGFAKLSQPVRNLILLLVRRGRIEQLPRVAAEFARRDDARNGLTHATATTAAPLDAEEVRALATRLEAMTGGRVALDTNVDPAILGGIVVRIGDRLIDGSVRGRLERLRGRLAAGTL